MRKTFFIVQCFFVVLLFATAKSFAQTPIKPKTNPLRQLAVQSLESSLEETRQVENLSQRIALSKSIIEMLIKENPARCREAIDRLFDSVSSSSDENANDNEVPEMIGRVIEIALLIDTKLAERYADKFKRIEAEKRHNQQSDSHDAAQASFMLRVASQLINKNRRLAISIAEATLDVETSEETLAFLCNLRKEDATSANQFALKVLQAIEARQAKNVNELFFLYAYVFAAPRVPFIASNQPAYFPSAFTAADDKTIDSSLAKTFLTKSIILLLNQERAFGGDSSAAVHGALGDYFFAKSVESQVAVYTPNIQQSLLNQQIKLLQFLEQNNVERTTASISKWAEGQSKNSLSPTVEELLEKAEKVENLQKKDAYIYQAAIITIKRNEPEIALKIAEKLSDYSSETIRPYVKYRVAQKFIEQKRFLEAEDISNKDADAARKSSLFVLLAKTAVGIEKSNVAQAAEYLRKAELTADKLSNYEKAVSLFAISSVYANFDLTEAIQVWRKGLTVANKVNGFTAQAAITRNFNPNGLEVVYKLFDENLNSQKVLLKAAPQTFASLLTDVLNIENRVFRIELIISVCSPIIDNKR